MPLPAALAAKLLKRGIINTTPSESHEEVIAEEYDEIPVPKKPSQDDKQLVDKIPACVNLSNSYHTCSDYCVKRYGHKRFKPDVSMLSKRDRLLEKYPLSDHWLEVADPTYNRYYYWNTQTDEVSWLPPSHPRSHVTLSHVRLKELNKPLHSEESNPSDEEEEEEDVRGRVEESKKTGKKKKGKRDDLDPMDPSAYSDVPRGDWKSGLDQRGSAKTGVDTTASGPLFQQRPYPSPGAILKMNKS